MTSRSSIFMLVIVLACFTIRNTLSAALVPIHSDHQNASLSLTAPIPPTPEGFDIEIKTRPNIPLNTIGVYIMSIQMLYDFAQQPWSQAVEAPSTTRREPAYNLQIHTLVATNLRHQSSVQYGFFVLALYRSVRLMAENWPGFVATETAILFHGKEVGFIKFMPLRVASIVQPSSISVNDSAIEDQNSNIETNSTNIKLTDYHGTIHDPQNPGFILRYTEIGPNIPLQDILFATLDGMTTAAQFDAQSICRGAVRGTTVGAAGIEFWIQPIMTSEGVQLPCWAVTRAYLLLSMQVVVRRRVVRELEVGIWWRAGWVGKGVLRRGGGGDGGVAAS